MLDIQTAHRILKRVEVQNVKKTVCFYTDLTSTLTFLHATFFFFAEKDEIFYDDFVEAQLLSSNVSNRHIHVTMLESSLIIKMADHVKFAQAQYEPTLSSQGILSGIQEEEKQVWPIWPFVKTS